MDNPQQPSSETPALPAGTGDLDGVITALAKEGLADYLADADVARLVVDWLHEETGIRRVFLNLAIKLVATLIERAAKQGGTWFGKFVADLLKQVLRAIPGYKKLVKALGCLVGRFDSEIAAKREFKEILAGRRPAAAARHAEDLPIDQRAQLRLLQDNRELDSAMDEGFGKTSAALAEIQSHLHSQPPLKLKQLPPERAQRFTYRAQVAPFVGREQELSALKAFCDADDGFRWWLVAGPGGQGKSRLAFELCLRRANAWHAGFLSDPKFGWREWEPERPTLIVADYAARDTDDLRKAAVALCDREQTFEFPVRLLLLERDPGGPWSETFEGTDNARYDLAAHRHGEPLVLDPLGDEALWKVMLAFFPRAGAAAPNKAETLGKLKGIDAAARPLFASLLADAWASGGLRPDWSKEDLLTHVLAREDDQFWEPARVDDCDRNLLALATMTGGIALGDALDHSAPGLLPDRSSFEPDRYEVMCGRPVDQGIPPLEPDMVGEFFVLSRLATPLAKVRGWAQQLHKLAWAASPLGIAFFLVRAVADFPRHESLGFLLDASALVEFHPNSPALRENQTTAAVALGVACGIAGDIAHARTLWERIRALAGAHPDEPIPREAEAAGALNLIKAYCIAGAIPNARSMWDHITKLAEAHPNEPALRDHQAKGAVNLIIEYGNAGEIAEARALWDRLEALAEDHADEPALREWQANGAFSLITEYGRAGETAEARALWERLAALAEAHADEPALRERQARGTADLILAYAKHGGIVASRGLWEDLATLAKAHSDEPVLRETLAMGAVNLINAYGIVGELAKGRALWEDLATLAKAHSDEPVLRETLAMGAVNLINAYGIVGELAKGRALWDRLAALSETHADEPVLREAQAKGAVNLIDAYGIAERIAEARALWESLAALAEGHPDEPVLREEQAKGAFNLITYYARAGAITKARTLWDRLAALAGAHADEPALRERQAKGAFNLLHVAQHNGDQVMIDSMSKAIDADAALSAAVATLSAQMRGAAGEEESGP